MQEQTQDLENVNFTESNPTDKIYADVEGITVSDKTMTGSVEFENFENIVQTTSLEEAGREEAAKVSKLKKKEDIEAKKHENEQNHGQTDVHHEGQAGGGKQHRVGRCRQTRWTLSDEWESAHGWKTGWKDGGLPT